MPGFTDRHIGQSATDRAQLLATLNLSSIDELVARAMPAAILENQAPDLGAALSEVELLDKLRELAKQNQLPTNFRGQGYFGTHVPPVIQRNVLENPAWYTAYTPYQPEISQGRLEAMLNFQTMIADLTGLDIAGASLLDESTAAAEAMTLMSRSHKGESNRLLLDIDTHPQTIEVLRTRAVPLGIELVMIDPTALPEDLDAFGALLSLPGSSGVVRELRPVVERLHAADVLVAVITDPLSLLLLTPPGELGADIAVGSAQRFGVPMAFGGPHAGYIAVRSGFERQLPGRLVGVSVDSHGKPAYRLSLQTREQHIRRDKATSNICTAQALLAVMASMYAVYHGWDGLRSIAEAVQARSERLRASLRAGGLEVAEGAIFDTVKFRTADGAGAAAAKAAAAGCNIRQLDQDWVAASVDETTTDAELAVLTAAFGCTLVSATASLPAELARKSRGLEHPVFNSYRSETDMMRYLRRLADLDLALDRTMIPLGSCTMKLNAAAEMAAITWPEFANVHPYAPVEQVGGWLALIDELEADLAALTGYDRVSIQPNAGSQGEFAGLLAVARYHAARGDAGRKVCLIPSSAHGTNAASAVMAGMRVVVVACDEAGNVDLADLRNKIAEHANELAAIMVTYPSTHGVYEDTITEICELVHAAGGQVYVDGANLNALVGWARPGKFGADVSHLNLHKTFAIPHGGGGPGVGPVAVRAHLAPYLPGDPLEPNSGAVSAAKYGSAGVLPISYAFIKMMAGAGLRDATGAAVLAANYIAKSLGEQFPVLYTNEHGLVAHECILDLRGITRRTGVTVDDVAKRLIDFGFHAPTMSFPVAGTLMVEPTESESKAELDRFISAMRNIAAEISAVEGGEVELAASPLRSAPHTAEALLGSDLPVAQRLAAGLPDGVNRRFKYWPPVGRVDSTYGDRNLVCSCPPVSDFA